MFLNAKHVAFGCIRSSNIVRKFDADVVFIGVVVFDDLKFNEL